MVESYNGLLDALKRAKVVILLLAKCVTKIASEYEGISLSSEYAEQQSQLCPDPMSRMPLPELHSSTLSLSVTVCSFCNLSLEP